MHASFALDLRVHRRKAGLSQGDAAHLLGVHPSKISLLEAGKALPSLSDLACLSTLYGKGMEEVFYVFMKDAREAIRSRLPSMPPAPLRWLPRFNRQFTLDALAERLSTSYDEV